MEIVLSLLNLTQITLPFEIAYSLLERIHQTSSSSNSKVQAKKKGEKSRKKKGMNEKRSGAFVDSAASESCQEYEYTLFLVASPKKETAKEIRVKGDRMEKEATKRE